MIEFKDICFFISHVESATVSRKLNYCKSKIYLLQHLEELESRATLLKRFEDFERMKCEFPNLELKRTYHTDLYADNKFYIVDGSNKNFSYAMFPNFAGEIGLMLTMYRCLTKFLASDKKFFLFLEDDIVVDENFAQPFWAMISHINFDFDFIALSRSGDQHTYYEQFQESYEFDNLVFCRNFLIYGTGVIFMSRQGAQKLLDVFDKYGFEYPLDWLFYNVRSSSTEDYKFETFALRPTFYTPFILSSEILTDSTIVTTQFVGAGGDDFFD